MPKSLTSAGIDTGLMMDVCFPSERTTGLNKNALDCQCGTLI